MSPDALARCTCAASCSLIAVVSAEAVVMRRSKVSISIADLAIRMSTVADLRPASRP
jgi:hypothetical protein